MNDIRICTVVTGKIFDEFLINLTNIQQVADFIELRVDIIQGFSIDQIKTIKNHTTKPAIFTCRKKNEGGMFEGSEEERRKIIEKACKLGFDYIDVELSAISGFDLTNLNNTKLVVSFHDFNQTPPLETLEEIKIKMKQYPEVIMKFATVINNDNDRNVLLQFLLDKQQDEEMIVIGTGEKGKIIRVIAPLLGSFCTFASTKYGETAPGQIDIEEMKKIYRVLNV